MAGGEEVVAPIGVCVPVITNQQSKKCNLGEERVKHSDMTRVQLLEPRWKLQPAQNARVDDPCATSGPFFTVCPLDVSQNRVFAPTPIVSDHGQCHAGSNTVIAGKNNPASTPNAADTFCFPCCDEGVTEEPFHLNDRPLSPT